MGQSWYVIKSNDAEANSSNLPIKLNLKIKIPYIHRQEPVIYNLAYKYNLEVKILEGSLGNIEQTEGLFYLQITGLIDKITQGLKYISSLNVEFGESSCHINN